MRKFVTLTCVLIGVSAALAGCSSHKSTKHAKLDPFAGKGSPYYRGSGPIPVGGGRYQVGKPYQVAGNWFTPREQPNYDKTGVSSWYGEAFHRRMTSNGEYFDMNQLTAAHATLPVPSYVRVTNLENDHSVILRVNDRGPFVGTRIIDVSKRAADTLGYKQKGTAKVRVKYLGPAPLNDPGARHLMAMNERAGSDVPRTMLADARTTKKLRKPAFEETGDTAAADDVASQPVSYAYYVQLGAFADPENVDRIRDGLSDAGPMQMAEISANSGKVYRLRLGPLKSAEEAQFALNQALSFGLPDAEVVQAPRQQASLR
jgi:rare lipoprotein A